MVAETAFRKARAAESRFTLKDAVSEDPRAIYLSSCAEIAGPFAELGYKYARSTQHFTKQKNDLTLQVSFQSSHNNVSGEYVALWIHANISSKRLKKWRSQQEHPLSTWGHLAGGQIGNLLAKPSWYEWNLAPQSERAALIQDAISTIENVALPYFSNFADVEALAKELERGQIASLDTGNAIEFLLCQDRRSTAIAHARSMLDSHGQIQPQYLKLTDNYRRSGIPRVQSTSLAASLAHVTVAYDLLL